jgi:hypothetical protein|tara:strand:+ start:230 stop:505 length:276 start_codon:yes stop_codon:yes gene_type:complete
MAKSKKKLKIEQASMTTMSSDGLVISGPVMSTSTVDTLDTGFSYSYDDIGQLDMFDEMDMREKYPALNQAYEHYQSVLEICKTKEKEDNED